MLGENEKLVVDAVIFDLDGTLIDSIDIYFKIVEIIFEKLDLPMISREVLSDAAKDGDFNWDIVLPEEVKDRKDEIVAKALGIINDIAPRLFKQNVKLIPGADKILKEISSGGMKIGLVTSTQKQYLKIKMQPLRTRGIEKLFDVIITSDDVQKRKPFPDPLVECVERLGIAPSQSVYVGDTRSDIRAGKAAGMKTIGVLTGFDNYETLKKEDPDAVIKSVDELAKTIGLQYIL